MLTVEQVLSSQKPTVEALIALSEKAFEGVESIVNLNLQVARASLTEAEEAVLAATSAKDAQALFERQAWLLTPNTESIGAYFRQLSEIASSLRPEIAKVIDQATGSVKGSVVELFDAASKNAPAGSENGIALWKSAVSAANSAFDNLQKAAQQASEIAEANVAAATEQVVKAAPRKAKRA
jgi:phasin family protein